MKGAGVCENLERAAIKLGPDLDDDMEGRLAFLCGIALPKHVPGTA